MSTLEISEGQEGKKVKKSKLKLGKARKKGKEGNGEEYPEEINPFGSSEGPEKSGKNGKNGKVKLKMKSKQKYKNSEDYPHENNPFIEVDEKIKKKQEKKEKKLLKKEQKREKKEAKRREKSETSDANCNKIDTLENQKNTAPMVAKATKVNKNKGDDVITLDNVPESSPLVGESSKATAMSATLPTESRSRPSQFETERPVSRTLLARTPEYEESSSGQTPLVAPKRVLQLKTGTDPGMRRNQQSTNKTPSLENLNKNIPMSRDASVSDVTDGFTSRGNRSQTRPVSLEMKRQKYAGSGTMLSPLHEEPHDDVKMYRTSSISKKGREKKKMRVLAKRLKKKKKTKNGKGTTLMDDEDVASQVVMRRPKVNIEALQREVDQVTESARTSIISLVEQRNSALDKLTESTRDLEEFSLAFARTAQETRLKQQARNRCCGFGSNWRICWYICACETRLSKKNKKKGKKENEELPESHELLENDDDDHYRPAKQTADVTKEKTSPERASTSLTRSSLSFSDQNLSKPRPEGGDRLGVNSQVSLRQKLLRVPKAVRCSMPQLTEIPAGASLRSMAEIDPRERKSSSVNALHEIVKKRGEKKRRARQEKDISKFASQYDDEETRKKVEELLRLDMQ